MLSVSDVKAGAAAGWCLAGVGRLFILASSSLWQGQHVLQQVDGLTADRYSGIALLATQDTWLVSSLAMCRSGCCQMLTRAG